MGRQLPFIADGLLGWSRLYRADDSSNMRFAAGSGIPQRPARAVLFDYASSTCSVPSEADASRLHPGDGCADRVWAGGSATGRPS
jgi:hypothetical protein